MGLVMTLAYQKKSLFKIEKPVVWFMTYMSSFLAFAYIGSFGGKQLISFPEDLILLLPFSMFFLYASNRFLTHTSPPAVFDAVIVE